MRSRGRRPASPPWTRATDELAQTISPFALRAAATRGPSIKPLEDEVWEPLKAGQYEGILPPYPSVLLRSISKNLKTSCSDELEDPIVWKTNSRLQPTADRNHGGWSGKGVWQWSARVPGSRSDCLGLERQHATGASIQRMVNSSPRFVLLSCPEGEEPEHWFRCGRDLALLLLDARRQGLASCWIPSVVRSSKTV